MVHHSDNHSTAGWLAPEGTFVIQLRSGSDVARGDISGRVEHVVSGESEPFSSLDEVLEFMARHAPPVTRSKGGSSS
jgi:hypothetical protein